LCKIADLTAPEDHLRRVTYAAKLVWDINKGAEVLCLPVGVHGLQSIHSCRAENRRPNRGFKRGLETFHGRFTTSSNRLGLDAAAAIIYAQQRCESTPRRKLLDL
jgi:hypothetical protein